MAYLIKTLVVSTGILWNAESLAKCSIAYNYVKAIFFPYTINIYHILFALLRHNQNHESAIIIERGNKKKAFRFYCQLYSHPDCRCVRGDVISLYRVDHYFRSYLLYVNANITCRIGVSTYLYFRSLSLFPVNALQTMRKISNYRFNISAFIYFSGCYGNNNIYVSPQHAWGPDLCSTMVRV